MAGQAGVRERAAGQRRLTMLGMEPAQEKPTLPDRLAVDPASPHHVAAVFEHPIGIRFNGRERHDVEEYCISQGWIKVAAGRALDRKGRPMMITLKGSVQAFYK